MDFRRLFGVIILASLPSLTFALQPKYYIHYCRPSCSPRTRIYERVDRRLFCYHPYKIPYGAYKYFRLAVRVARHYGIDPLIFCAQIECESCWNPNAISPGGGYGLTQITGRGDSFRLLDPLYNLRLGAQIKSQSYRLARKILKQLGESNPSNRCISILALRIYNGGTRFLKKELRYIVFHLNQSPCSWKCQQDVCARDKCLWKVNIVYVIRVTNSSLKYSRLEGFQ